MTLLAIATAVQFVVLLVLAVVVLSLARQVGILHERLSPAGMTRTQRGVEPGQTLPALELRTLLGNPVDLHDGRSALLFLSANCPICRSVLPAFETALADAGLPGYWVADGLPGPDGQMPDYDDYAERQHIDPDRFLVSQELGLTLGVRQIPALVLVGDQGRFLSRETVSGPVQVARLLAGAAAQLATPRGEKST